MSKHQKRLSAPRNYPIERKDNTYIIKGKGPHSADEGLPLLVVLRDVLGYADTRKEAQQVLDQDKVLVDGTIRRNLDYTVGFMDVLSFPDMDENYRVLLTTNGFVLKQVDDADHKLSRIQDKTTLKGGITQVNLHDGNNVETDDNYATKSTVVLALPDKDIEKEITFEEGNLAYVKGGKHAGVLATIAEIEERSGTHPRTVTLETEDGDEFKTVEKNVYMVGENNPEVDVDVTK